MDTLGKRIKFIREQLRFNQSELAKHLGLESPMAISKYESDQREPDIDKLIKLSNLGDISLDWLLTGEGEKKRIKGPFISGEKLESLFLGTVGAIKEVEASRVSEPSPAYHITDLELKEILEWLKENPQDKRLFTKAIKAKKELKEALDALAKG